MTDRIPLIQAAKIAGDAPGTYTAMLSTAERRAGAKGKALGKKFGRERMVSLAETVVLRTTTELTGGNIGVHDAFNRALGLMPFIAGIITRTGPLGSADRETYAVDCWGMLGESAPRGGLLCVGADVLAECMRWLAGKGYTQWRVINLTRIAAEVLTGWQIATLGPDEASARFVEDLGRMPEQSRVFYDQLYREMERRLGGGRRAEPPRGGDWKIWVPPPHVAAAAMGASA